MRRIALLSVVAAAAGSPVAQAAEPPPRAFVGMVADGPLVDGTLGPVAVGHELDVMRSAGVGTVRFALPWSVVQPDPRQPPVLDGPDAFVGAAADRGFTLLPVVVDAPRWASRSGSVRGPLRDNARYGALLTALVARYGPDGTLWETRSRRSPIRRWQIWNEPHLTRYWDPRTWARDYAALVGVSRRALRAADPGAKVVLAATATDASATSWRNLDDILVEGAGPDVDEVAVNAFTRRPSDLVRILSETRKVMRDYTLGRAPLTLTEWSWPSSVRPGSAARRLPWSTSETGQAARVRSALALLARHRRQLRLSSAYHYTWLSRDRGRSAFGYAGLRKLRADGRITAKPALAAFRSAVSAR